MISTSRLPKSLRLRKSVKYGTSCEKASGLCCTGIYHNDITYHANYDAFKQTDEAVGESGFVMTSVERTPVQKLWIEFTGIERFSVDWHEERETVERVLDAIMAKQQQMWEIVADSPAA